MRTEVYSDFEMQKRCMTREIERTEIQNMKLQDEYNKILKKYEERLGMNEALRSKEMKELDEELKKQMQLSTKKIKDKNELEALKKSLSNTGRGVSAI